MKTPDTYTDRSLQKLFQQLKEEKLPENLDSDIMKQVYQLHKKRRLRTIWFTWSTVSVASAGIIIFAIKVFRHLNIDFKQLFTLPEISLHEGSLYLLVGGIALFLLWLDYRLRKTFLK